MSMKLSYRDKIIIIVVAVLVVLGVGIFCFIKPRYDDLKISQSRLASKQEDKAAVEEKIGTLEGLKKRLEDMIKAVTEDQKNFVSERECGYTYQVNQYIMDKLSTVIDFNVVSMNTTLLNKTAIAQYTYNKTAVAYPLKINGDIANKLPPEVSYAFKGSYPNPPAGVDISASVVNIGYECEDIEQVLGAIQVIADDEKYIYLTKCTGEFKSDEELEKQGDTNEPAFKGEMEIVFYEIYPLDPADIDADIELIPVSDDEDD